MCGYCGCGQSDHHHHHHDDNIVKIEQDILADNQRYADANRQGFAKAHILAINLVSSPGSGKTTLLCQTIQQLNTQHSLAVIEGDQQTDRDAQRIAKTGVPVHQLNTGTACHLDAHAIGHGVDHLKPDNHSILFIENVGNLVCPALFDLGEAYRVVILSVTEGDDKPLKYPHMFQGADLMIINKLDLLPHVEFDLDACIDYAKRANPNIDIIKTEAISQAGVRPFCAWLQQRYATFTA